MNEQELVEIESAYGSATSLDSKSSIKKNTLKKPSSRRRNRCKNQKCKLREHPILEAVFFLILVFLLITCYRITSQNQETQKMILSLQSQLNSVEKHIGEDLMNMKEDIEKLNENEIEKAKTALKEVLKEVPEPHVLLEQSHPIINITTNSEETHVQQNVQTVLTNFTNYQYNAANFIVGSWVDASLSSSSSLNPLIGFDQSSLVLVDRPKPPANKAWCTYDKNPVLTVDLGWYIEPTAVSYQHSKWDGTIPDDAPKEYSVEACLDNHCINRKPLFSHCEYNQHGPQEQICNNTSHDSINSPVGKVQFRFHKNHGNTERTCVSLVKVYSETEVVKEKKFRDLKDTTTCLDLNHDYHNNPIKYKYFTHKHCALLYSKGCCQECPECCEECDIKDINGPVVRDTILISMACFTLIGFALLLIILVVRDVKSNRFTSAR